MPYRRLPNTIASTLRTLTAARDKYLATTDPAERAFGTDLFAQLDPTVPGALLNRFAAAVSAGDAAHDLAVKINNFVEFFYLMRDPSESSRRVKAERWGVVYINDNGTTTPDPTPSPTPTPAPTTPQT